MNNFGLEFEYQCLLMRHYFPGLNIGREVPVLPVEASSFLLVPDVQTAFPDFRGSMPWHHALWAVESILKREGALEDKAKSSNPFRRKPLHPRVEDGTIGFIWGRNSEFERGVNLEQFQKLEDFWFVPLALLPFEEKNKGIPLGYLELCIANLRGLPDYRFIREVDLIKKFEDVRSGGVLEGLPSNLSLIAEGDRILYQQKKRMVVCNATISWKNPCASVEWHHGSILEGTVDIGMREKALYLVGFPS